MARDQSPSTTSTGRWRAEPSDAARRSRRYVRVVVSLSLLLGLVGFYLWNLWEPLYRPRVAMLLLRGNYPLHQPRALSASQNEQRSWQLAAEAVSAEVLNGSQWLTLDPAHWREQVQNAGAKLSGGNYQTVICCVAAQGVEVDRVAYLLGDDFHPADGSSRRIPLSELVSAVDALPAAHKLLVVDNKAVRSDHRLGVLWNQFAAAAARNLQELRPATTWVLLSHQDGERSEMSQDGGQSAFIRAVTRGLSGEADENHDRRIAVDELTTFVMNDVQQWVDSVSLGRATQHPQVIPPVGRGGRELASADLLEINAGTINFEVSPGLAPIPLAWTTMWRDSERSLAGFSQTLAQHTRLVASHSSTPASSAQGATAGSDASGNTAAPPSNDSGGAPSPANSPSDGAAPTENVPAAGLSPSMSLNDAQGMLTAAVTQQAQAALAAEARARRDLATLVVEGWRLVDLLRADEVLWRLQADGRLALRGLQSALVSYEALARFGAVDEVRSQTGELRQRLRDTRTTIEGIIQADFLLALAEATPESTNLPLVNPAVGGLTAIHPSQALPPTATAIARMYQELLDSVDRKEEPRWGNAITPALRRQIAEFRLAESLPLAGPLEPSLYKQAIETRRLAEETVADAAICFPWSLNHVALADRVRLAAEESLLDRVKGTWSDDAERVLNDAQRLYRSCRETTRTWRKIQQLSENILWAGPEHLHWLGTTRDGGNVWTPSRASLADLWKSNRELLDWLQQPPVSTTSDAAWQRLLQLAEEVETEYQQIQTLLDKNVARLLDKSENVPGREWLAERLLETTLLTGEQRAKLLQMIETSRPDDVPRSAVTMSSPSRPIDLGLPMASLQFHWLAMVTAADSSLRTELLQTAAELDSRAAENINDSLSSSASLDETFTTATRSLVRAYESLWDFATKENSSASMSSNLTSIYQQWALRSRALAAADPRDFDGQELVSLNQRQRDWWELALLASQLERLGWEQLSCDEGRRVELESLQDQLEQELQHRSSGVGTSNRHANLPLRSVARVDLTRLDETVVEMIIDPAAAGAEPGWVVLTYDEALLEVTPVVGDHVYGPAQLSKLLASNRTAAVTSSASLWPPTLTSPLFPELTQLLGQVPPSYRGAKLSREPIRFTVRRGRESRGTTPLIAYYVSANAWQKKRVDVDLPEPLAWDVEISGPAGTAERQPDRWTIYPFPNRATPLAVQLRSYLATESVVDCSIYALEENDQVPYRAFSGAEAGLWRQRFATRRPVVQIPQLRLAAQASLPLMIPAVAEPKAGAPASAPDNAPANAPPKIPAKTGSAEMISGEPIPHGLVIVLHEASTGKVELIPLSMRVQRPRRYVTPRLSWDPQQQRLLAELLIGDVSAIPKTGIPIRLYVDAGGDQNAPTEANARLLPDPGTLKMELQLPDRSASSGTDQAVYLDVDGYPRAFIYRLAAHERAGLLQEVNDPFSLHFDEPLPQTHLGRGRQEVNARLRLDVPAGAWETGEQRARLILDLGADDQYAAEPQVELSDDRSAQVYWLTPGPTGSWQVGCHVTDLQLTLSPPSEMDVVAQLLLQYEHGEGVTWHRGPDVVLDTQAPEIAAVRAVDQEGAATIWAEQGTQLELRVETREQRAADLQQIEAGLDSSWSETPAASFQPQLGTLDARHGWIVRVPIEQLPLGVHALRVRPTDLAGNVGPWTVLAVNVVPPGTRRTATTNSLRGTVLLAKQPIPAARVVVSGADGKTLAETKTNAAGEFRLDKVPVGTHLLSVQASFRTIPVVHEGTVDVTAPPTKIPPLQIQVR